MLLSWQKKLAAHFIPKSWVSSKKIVFLTLLSLAKEIWNKSDNIYSGQVMFNLETFIVIIS